MEDNPQLKTEEELQKWVKKQLDSAVRELMDQGLFHSVMVEAKPAWVFPFGLLIGMIREQDQRKGFDWFITGDFPTARVSSSVAQTPRDVARHFALKWQLEAKRLEDTLDTESESVTNLVQRAQSLYELVEQDALWES